MGGLSVLLEDSAPNPPSVFVCCANPIFLNNEPVWSDGAEFIFEVLETEASTLKLKLDKREQYSLDGGPLFFGELSDLQPCDSTHPALSLLRNEPTLRGVMRVLGIVNLRASTKTVN